MPTVPCHSICQLASGGRVAEVRAGVAPGCRIRIGKQAGPAIWLPWTTFHHAEAAVPGLGLASLMATASDCDGQLRCRSAGSTRMQSRSWRRSARSGRQRTTSRRRSSMRCASRPLPRPNLTALLVLLRACAEEQCVSFESLWALAAAYVCKAVALVATGDCGWQTCKLLFAETLPFWPWLRPIFQQKQLLSRFPCRSSKISERFE